MNTPPLRDNPDALIDQLLRELLGNDRPRDLTARVLEHAKAHDRARRAFWTGTLSAIAASLILAVTTYALWPAAYPSPHRDDGTLVERGSTITTEDDEQKSLDLGGYVNVALAPESKLRVGGSKFSEKVFLDQGEIAVAVKKNKGKFDVEAGPATVRVTGTKFRVALRDRVEREQLVKNLVVSVEEGSVQVDGIDQSPIALGASDGERTFPISTSASPSKRPLLREATPDELPPAVTTTSIAPSPREPVKAPATRPATTKPAGNITFTPLDPKPGRAFQVILHPGRLELRGILRREQNFYFLATDDGRFLLFPQSEPLPNLPDPGKRVVVLFEAGKATRVTLAPLAAAREKLEKSDRPEKTTPAKP